MKPKGVSAYANPEANARTYPAPDGDERLNVSAILARVPGLTSDKFLALADRDLPGLGTLLRQQEPIAGTGNREATFLWSQVQAHLAWNPYLAVGATGPGWVDEYTYRDKKGRVYLTMQGMQEKFPDLPRKSIERWACEDSPCRFLTDPKGKRRPIDHLKVAPPTPRNVPTVTVYLLDDLEEIQRRRDDPPGHEVVRGKKGKRLVADEFHTDEKGIVWGTAMQVAQKLGVNESNWCYDMAERESLLRPGEKALRPKTIPNPVPQKGSPGEITVFRMDDAQRIMDGDECKGPWAGGSGELLRKIRERRIEKAKEVLRALLPWQEKKPRSHVFAQAEKFHQVCKGEARRAFEALNGRERKENGTKILWYLPQTAFDLGLSANPSPTTQPTGRPGPKKRRAGRLPSQKTEEVLKFCYERYIAGDKLVKIRAKAKELFGPRAPKEDRHVTKYAQRYAERYSKPLDRPSPQ